MEGGRASLRRRLRQLIRCREKCAAGTVIGLGCAAPRHARCLAVGAAEGAPAARARVTRVPVHARSLWQAAGHPCSRAAHPCRQGISECGSCSIVVFSATVRTVSGGLGGAAVGLVQHFLTACQGAGSMIFRLADTAAYRDMAPDCNMGCDRHLKWPHLGTGMPQTPHLSPCSAAP